MSKEKPEIEVQREKGNKSPNENWKKIIGWEKKRVIAKTTM